jgi:hypothetical protein
VTLSTCPLFTCPLSHCPMSHCPTAPFSHCPSFPKSHCPIVHCPLGLFSHFQGPSVPLSITPWPLPDCTNAPSFIFPPCTAPPSHGLIVPLSTVSLSTVRSKCLIAPLSSARLPHGRIVHCPIVRCLIVPLSTVPVSIVPLSDCPLSPLSHCCTALWLRGLQARVRHILFCVNHSSRGMICASVRHAKPHNR